MSEDLRLGEVLEDAVGTAIYNAVAEHEGGLVVKWIALVETISPDGDQGVWKMTSLGASPWDKMGLLQYGMQTEKREAFAFPDDDEEDE